MSSAVNGRFLARGGGMIGKGPGDVVEVITPAGVKAYEILKVEWI